MGLECLLDPRRLNLAPTTSKMHGPGSQPRPKQRGSGMIIKPKETWVVRRDCHTQVMQVM
jgi:hypothetical protein